MSKISAEVIEFEQKVGSAATATLMIMASDDAEDFDVSGDIDISGQLVGTADGRAGVRYGDGPDDIFFLGDRFVLELKRVG